MSGSTTTVHSGHTLSGAHVGGANIIDILSGGSGLDLTAGNPIPGGTIIVNGTDTDASLYFGGKEDILSGGIARDTTITNVGAQQIVSKGGTAIGTDDSGAQFLNSGATAISTFIRDGAGEVISAGAVSSDTFVFSGGFVVELPGATLDPPLVQSGAIIMSTGIAVYDPLSGFSSDTTAEAKGLQLSSGAIEYVLSGGDAKSTTISSGGSQLVVSGGVAEATTVSSGGIETVDAYGESLKTKIVSGGTEVVAGGSAVSTTIAGGTLELETGAITTSGIDFTKTGGDLDIVNSGAVPTTVISGFAKGDIIDFGFLTSSAGDKYSVSGDTVTISAGGHTYNLDINMATPGGYQLIDGPGGTLALAVCYFPGTLIRTPTGDVPVEKLSIGDDVVTSPGDAMPIRWIGRNTVSTRFADPLRVLPIRIRAGALGENQPERDLLVSPEHAVLVDDILVQAAALVNGVSILREADVPEIFTYYHVELAEHALILAEGLPAESFVDNVHRMAFENWEEHEALYGDSPVTEMRRPRAQSYRQVPTEIHHRVMERARMLPEEAARRVA